MQGGQRRQRELPHLQGGFPSEGGEEFMDGGFHTKSSPSPIQKISLSSSGRLKDLQKITSLLYVPEEKKREVQLKRSDDRDFGFTLRHFIVYPPDEAEDRCELEEALFLNHDHPLDTIFVIHVRRGSPAFFAGLHTGDRILSVNDSSIEDRTYQQIVSIIQSSKSILKLIVVSEEDDIIQQAYIQAAHNPESNLNFRFQVFGFPSPFSCSSSLSSQSSLSSIYQMPSPISYQSTHQKPSSFAIVPPRNPPKPLIPPFAPVSRLSPTPHRKGHVSVSKARLASPSRHASSQNGSKTYASSHQQSKRKTHSGNVKDSNKKRTPNIIDRKQAVYGTGGTLTSRHKSASDQSLERKLKEKTSNTSDKHSVSSAKNSSKLQNSQSTLNDNFSNKSRELIECVEKDISKSHRESNERLCEIVQTKIIGTETINKDSVVLNNKRASLPVVKSNTESSIPNRRDSSQFISKIFSYPSKAVKLDVRKNEESGKNASINCSNKENIGKNRSMSLYTPDRPTQEAIERMKRNFERKEEFLKRPNQPFWRPASPENMPLREYPVNPQKLQRNVWPPSPVIADSLSKAQIYEDHKNNNDQSKVLRRIKSDIDERRVVSMPITESKLLEQYSQFPLSYDSRCNSLPTSPDSIAANAQNQLSVSSPVIPSSLYSSHHGTYNPLTGNIVAKPYVKHLSDDGTFVSKANKPFVSTLSRIHENIPSSNRDLLPSTSSVLHSSLVTTSPSDSFGSFSSLSTLPTTTTSITRTIPFAWIGDNERIKQLQIVSTRAKKFETINEGKGEKKSSPNKLELSRLSQRDNASVADRKKEFELKENENNRINTTGVSYEFGTCFDCSSRLKKLEDASWKSSKGIVKSLSDGGEFFAASRDYFSLPEVKTSLPKANLEPPSISGSGNRMMPIGGTKIHCEPPNSQEEVKDRPQNDSDLFERDRTSSVWSYDSWSAGENDEAAQKRKSGPLVRQHSFHSTLQAHLARAVAAVQQRLAAGTDGTTSVAAASSTGGSVVYNTPSISVSTTANGIRVSTPGVPKRGKHLLGEEHDRLVRRVSYLKATSGDRIYSDSEAESDEELKSSTGISPVCLARRALGYITPSEDLPSPGSFLSSESHSGTLQVKIAKVHGKRATDRSWKTVWVVIRGRALFLYKDKAHAVQTPLSPEDQVTLRGIDAGVASDYTKRRHVFRLSTPAGSQFLLQAESEPAMTAWLNSITVASQDVEPHLKGMGPVPDNDFLSQEPSSESMVTSIPPSSNNTGSLYPPSPQDMPPTTDGANLSPQLPCKNKKVTSPLKPKSPGITYAKSRKQTHSEFGTSPKSKTWKGRIGRHLRKMQGSSSLNPPAVPLPEGASIGVCLEDCPPSEENSFVPLLVSLCVGVVEARGLHIQGIYRIPGNRAAVTHLIETVNRGPHAIDLSDTRWSDVNVISSLLKQFFQRLPDPLIPSDLYPQFIEASKIEDPQQRIVEIRNLLQDLPDHHYETLKFLCLHLHHVVSNSSDNKMDVRNLAIVFGPTLVRAADDNMAKMVTDMSHQCRIVEMLISHASWFFSEDECDEPPPVISVGGMQSHFSSDVPVSNSAEMEASSQSLLLGNVQKLEASHRDHKKLLVSSIISAANRRVQKARKKIEEENSSSSNAPESSTIPSYNEMLGHQNEEADISSLPAAQRRVPSVDTTHFGNGNRDGRLFEDNCNPLLDRGFEKLDTFSSHHNYSNLSNPQSVGAYSTSKESIISSPIPTSGGSSSSTLNTSSFSKSEPLYIANEDLPIRTYAGLSASTQERIRRFELETRAMLMKKDVTRQRREVLDKHKIEEELQKAKKDLETEDIFDKLADNPSQVVHMMNDYCWTPNREAVSLPSLRPSVPSDSFKSHLAKPSFVSPTTGLTNASAKDDKSDYSESELGLSRTNQEGSDLLNAINATFEKMKSLQEDSSLFNLGNKPPQESSSRTSSPSPSGFRRKDDNCSTSCNDSGSSCHSNSSSCSSSNSVGGTKCKLYRDPSLHRRRTLNAAIKSSSATQSSLSTDENLNDNQNCEHSSVFQEKDSLESVNDISSLKEKQSEKRNRELLRTETQESLREKKPKELKRSSVEERNQQQQQQQQLFGGDIGGLDPRSTPVSSVFLSSSSKREKQKDSSVSSSELRSRKHNVKELKEKFERSLPPTQMGGGVTVPNTTSKNSNVSNSDKPSRGSVRASRKSRIKRRHTVGGMKDLARVAWLKVIEAAHYSEPLKTNQGCQISSQSTQLPTWEQLQMFLEAFAEGRKLDAADNQQCFNMKSISKDKIGTSTPDLESILSLVLPPQQKEALKRRLSVREPSRKHLHPVLESNV